MATPRASIAVVPGGGENVNSVLYALERLDVRPVLTLDAATVASAERVILMGVGAAPPAMAKLQAHGLVDCLRDLQQPVLGICVGMQLLFERSAEGDVPCLGLLPGRVEALPAAPDLPVPRVLATRDGAGELLLDLPGGGTSVVRLLTFLHGEPLHKAPRSAAQRRSREMAAQTGTWKIGNTGKWKIKDEK